MKQISIMLTLFVLSVSCNNDDDSNVPLPVEFNFTFETGTENWNSFFSDYPVGEEEFYELAFDHTNLPSPLDENVKALRISGNNHSDDLFSAVYRKFEGLKANTDYKITFDIELASNAPKNAFGVGGSPDLALGAGGVDFLLQNTVDDSNHYRPNFISKLQSGESNNILKVVGTIGVSDEIPTPFTLVNRNNLENPITLTSNDKGEIWLMIATDSGFEATTTLYYKSINIKFQ